MEDVQYARVIEFILQGESDNVEVFERKGRLQRGKGMP